QRPVAYVAVNIGEAVSFRKRNEAFNRSLIPALSFVKVPAGKVCRHTIVTNFTHVDLPGLISLHIWKSCNWIFDLAGGLQHMLMALFCEQLPERLPAKENGGLFF